jgi:hypothetical protein
VIVFKFLRAGAVGPFSGFRWPLPSKGAPGDWVDAGHAPASCRSGVHACRPQDLPWWLAAELWQAELSGDTAIYEHKVAAPRGRLLRRCEQWTPELGCEYAAACAWRARDHAIAALQHADTGDAGPRLASCNTLDELVDASRQLATAIPAARISLTMAGDGAVRALANAAATSAYIAAHAAGRIGGERGVEAERRWQSEWLLARIDPLNEARVTKTGHLPSVV